MVLHTVHGLHVQYLINVYRYFYFQNIVSDLFMHSCYLNEQNNKLNLNFIRDPESNLQVQISLHTLHYVYTGYNLFLY